MGRSAEAWGQMQEQDELDLLECERQQVELEERRRREDAALARARISTKELRDIINSIHNRTAT